MPMRGSMNVKFQNYFFEVLKPEHKSVVTRPRLYQLNLNSMKKQILFALFPLFIAANLNAQVSYSSTNYGVAGDSLFYTEYNADTSTLVYALAGTNMNWNFSSLSPTNQGNLDFMNPQTAGYRNPFIQNCVADGGTLLSCNNEFNTLTNLAFREPRNVTISGFTFRNIVDNDLKSTGNLVENIIGLSTTISGVNVRTTATYTPPDLIYTFPISYGNRDSSVSSYIVDLIPQGLDFTYNAHQKRVNHVDAWGSLTTPHTTYPNTVRLYSTILHIDTIYYNNQVFPLPIYTSFEYSWFDTSFVAPVMTAQGNFVGNSQHYTYVDYIDTIHCLVPVARQNHAPGLPVVDPSIGFATVNFINNSYNSNTYFWNFGDPSSGILDTSSAMDPNHNYDQSGTYDIEYIACNTACIPEKCDTLNFTSYRRANDLLMVPQVPDRCRAT